MHIPTVLTSLPTWPAAAPPTTTTAITASSTLPCNGHPSLCARQYSNISFIGTHNSAFVGSLHDPRVNQQLSMTAQLDAGIRFLQAQTHVLEPLGQVKMCHTHCYIKDAGSLESYLTTVRTWMEAKGHEREVITLLLVNGDGADVSKFGEVFETTGLAKFAFTPATSSQKLDMQAWPTLGSMIDAGTRLVVFLDARADTLSVPYILDEFTYLFETPYPSTTSCALDRPAHGTAEGRMYLMNHFVDDEFLGIATPDNEHDFRTNAAQGKGSIGESAERCEGLWGRRPNLVLVDMFDRGQVGEAEGRLNGV